MNKATNIIPKLIISPIAIQAIEFIRVNVISYNIPSYIGDKYVIHFIYIVTYFYWIRFYYKKGNAFIQIKEFKTFIENQTGLKIKIFGLNSGLEFGLPTRNF